MLRISLLETAGETSTFRLEGRILGPWVDELRSFAEGVMRRGGRLKLELSEVSFIDGAGVQLIRELEDQGVDVTGASPFISAQLDGGDRDVAQGA
jgi:hypothetical protein